MQSVPAAASRGGVSLTTESASSGSLHESECPEGTIRPRLPSQGSDEKIVPVPRISSFFGIVIEMYYGDHPPPHFFEANFKRVVNHEVPTPIEPLK